MTIYNSCDAYIRVGECKGLRESVISFLCLERVSGMSACHCAKEKFLQMLVVVEKVFKMIHHCVYVRHNMFMLLFP